MGGSVAISQNSATQLDISQSSTRAVINWNSFNIAAGYRVNIAQPSSSSTSIQQVIGTNPSEIFGRLSSNGQVVIANPNGIHIGQGALIDVAGIVATTARLSRASVANFVAGSAPMIFDVAGRSDASIVNEGTITVAERGLAALVAPGVRNAGLIEARLGTVRLASANRMTLDFWGDGLVSFAVTEPSALGAKGPDGQPLSASIENSGTIRAAGGRVLLTATAAQNVVDNAINMGGLIDARAASVTASGTVILDGGAGTTVVGGKIDASGRNTDQRGGNVEVLGGRVGLLAGSVIDVSGDTGGGTALIGGNFRGLGPQPNSAQTVVEAGALVDADAITSGTGGKIIVWGSDFSATSATLRARGGISGGDGGEIETSGKVLNIGQDASINVAARAANSRGGSWLLDPVDASIETTSSSNVSFASGTYSSNNNNDFSIGSGALSAALSDGATVTVDTTKAGGISNGGIVISSGRTIQPIGANATLILKADGAIVFNGGISASTGKPLNLKLQANSNIVISANIDLAGGSFTTTSKDGTGSAVNFSSPSTVISNVNAFSLNQSGPVILGTVTAESLSITAGGRIAASGSIEVKSGTSSFTTGAYPIALSQSNKFAGAVSLSNSGANDVALTDTGTNSNFILGTVSVGTGMLSIRATGRSIVQTGAITQAAGAGTASFESGSNGITLTNAGNVFTGAVALNGNAIELNVPGALVLGRVIANTQPVSITAGGAITQVDKFTTQVGAGVSFSAGANSITLTNANNEFLGNVSLSNSGANNVAITTRSNLRLGTVSVGSGTLAVTATNSIIEQIGSLTQAAGAGAASFTAGGIVLTNARNDFTGSVSLSATAATSDVSITDANALNLGTVSVGRNLTIVTTDAISLPEMSIGQTSAFEGRLSVTSNGGAITQTGPLTTRSGATFSAGRAPITLTNSSNNFRGSVSLSNSGANNVAITNANALTFNTVSAGSGTLTVIASGAITQTGAITQAADAGAASFSAGANAITLTNSDNDFKGAVSLSNSGANNISITDTNALSTGTLNAGQDLSIKANGAILIGAGGISAGRDLSIEVSGAISIDALSFTRNLSVISNGGAITQAVALTVPGTATFSAGAAPIALTNSNNNFQNTVSLSNSGTNNVAITNANALKLGDVSVGSGTLTVTASGAITQEGMLTQSADAGAASFSAGANAISLSGSTANDFTGTVSLSNSGANNVSIRDRNALRLGTVSVGTGTLTVNTNGAITQTGAITQAAGADYALFKAQANPITLTNAGNDFKGTVYLSNSGANNLSITSVNDLTLQAGSSFDPAIGQLVVNAGGVVNINETISAASITFGSASRLAIDTTEIKTTGSQTYNAPITISKDMKFTSTGSGDIIFNSTLNGEKSISVNTAGLTKFDGIVGGVTPLKSVTADAPVTIDTTEIKTSGAQTYNAPVTISKDVKFTSTRSGDILFNGTLIGAKSLSVNSAGLTKFGGIVGGMSPLTSVTTDATVTIDTTEIKTTGSQTYNAAVTISKDVTFTSTSAGDIIFNSTLNGAKSLNVNTAGLTKFGGIVGGVTPLTSVKTDAPGSIVLGASVFATGTKIFGEIPVATVPAPVATVPAVDPNPTARFAGAPPRPPEANNIGSQNTFAPVVIPVQSVLTRSALPAGFGFGSFVSLVRTEAQGVINAMPDSALNGLTVSSVGQSAGPFTRESIVQFLQTSQGASGTATQTNLLANSYVSLLSKPVNRSADDGAR